jgi:hypothetical protein
MKYVIIPIFKVIFSPIWLALVIFTILILTIEDLWNWNFNNWNIILKGNGTKRN